MPITLSCPCGKSLRIADEHAGRAVKCPICGAIQKSAPVPVAPPPVADAETFDDFVVLEDTSPDPLPPPPEPVPSPPVPARARVKAAAVAEEPPLPPVPPAPAPAVPKPKKKKRRRKVEGAPEDDDWYERVRANEAWMKRMVRGWAYVIAGALILIGVAVIYLVYWDDVHWMNDPRTKLGIIVFGICGLAAIGKGAFGLLFGQFLGDED